MDNAESQLVSNSDGVTPFEVYNLDNPNSLVNLLPINTKIERDFYEQIVAVPEELKDRTERELFDIAQPNKILQTFRHSFWAEVRLALQLNREISLTAALSGVTTTNALKRYLNPRNVAYLLCPTQEYFVQLEHAHDLALQGVIEILSEPRTGDKKQDYNYDRLKLEIFKFLNDKKHGAAVQKQLTITKNLDNEAGSGDKNIEDLEKELHGDVIEIKNDE